VRHNADSISVVSALTSLGLPAIAIGQTRLFDRPEIKLLLSFLNFLTAPADSQHLYYLVCLSVCVVYLSIAVLMSKP
jgi:superfamily I DNA/RNA helicase